MTELNPDFSTGPAFSARPAFSTEVMAGSLPGVAEWDGARQTFAATVRVFGGDGPYPPPLVRYGTRAGEFPTVDALAHHLARVGLALDADSCAALDVLGRAVGRVVGSTVLVGVVAGARCRLFLRTPVGHTVELAPPLDHPDHGLGWGDASPATVATARVIGSLLVFGGPADGVDLFALAVTAELLSQVTGDFAVDAAVLCDWYLVDEPLTVLDPVEVARLRAEMDRLEAARPAWRSLQLAARRRGGGRRSASWGIPIVSS
ncbi:MAG: hypothetical protein AAF467_20745 [Actinomycetota bacterium]